MKFAIAASFAAITLSVQLSTLQAGSLDPDTPGRRAMVGADSPQDSVILCGIRQGRLARILGAIDPLTGDTTVAGSPLREALPREEPPYIGSTEWNRRNEPIILPSGLYGRDGGGPRMLLPEELDPVPAAWYRGVPVFVDGSGKGGYFYILVSPDCRFQPFVNMT